MATQIMSILHGKYITYVKLINPEDALHGQKFHFLKNLIYTDVRFGTVLSINISSFKNNFSQMSVLYLQTNVPVTSYIYPYILGNWHYCELSFIPGRFSFPRLLFLWCILKNMTPEAAIMQIQPSPFRRCREEGMSCSHSVSETFDLRPLSKE